MRELALPPVKAEDADMSHEASGGFVIRGVFALPDLVLSALANGVISGLSSGPPHVDAAKSLEALGV